MVYAALNPAQLYEVLSLISQEVRRMFTDKITKEQLSKAREQLKSNFLLSLENAANRMNSIGRTMLMLNKVVTPDELITKLDAVDMDAFYAVCDKIFKLRDMSISLVGKQVEGMKESAISEAVLA
jgi:predicted Zn-dependent peptidase